MAKEDFATDRHMAKEEFATEGDENGHERG